MNTVTIDKKTVYQPKWIREDYIDLVFGQISPMLTWRAPKGRVINRRLLPDNMVEITLEPNRHFRPYQAGQFIFVTVQINGVNEQRAYSIVNAPAEHSNGIVLAVKVQGKVSRYLANDLEIGDVIDISQAQGDFIVNKTDTARLFIAAGSGITPIMSMLAHVLNLQNTSTHLLYISRDPVYQKELEALACQHSHFTLTIIQDSSDKPARFSEEMLESLNIIADEYQTYLCGAPGLMRAVNELWQKKGIAHLLTQENFVTPAVTDDAESYLINFRQKQRSFESSGNILSSAEKAGLNPASGCRMGICNTCVCQKVSGTVRNQITGAISNRPNESIKLCINEALSPLEINA